MPKTNQKVVCSAGEHYVGYELSCMGYVVALTREGAPTVDILVCNAETTRTLSIQVKTTGWAMRTRGRGKNKQPHHLEFPLGRRSATHSSENLVFAFVDLRHLDKRQNVPDVYIVPSQFVYDHCKDWADKAKMVRFHISIERMEQFKNNWQPIYASLAG